MISQRGLYAVKFKEISITAAGGDWDLFLVDPAADKPVELVACYVGNKSETGDAAEEMVSYSVTRFTGGTFTSGDGTSFTPLKRVLNDASASFAAEVAGTSSAGASVATTSGTEEELHVDTFNIRAGMQAIWPPDQTFLCAGVANEAIVVRLETALADDATISGTLLVRELL